MAAKQGAADAAEKDPASEPHQAAEQAAPPDLVSVTVAPRRTVAIVGKVYHPGMMLSLPADEVRRLRSLGYLVDPGADDVEVQDGSSVHPR